MKPDCKNKSMNVLSHILMVKKQQGPEKLRLFTTEGVWRVTSIRPSDRWVKRTLTDFSFCFLLFFLLLIPVELFFLFLFLSSVELLEMDRLPSDRLNNQALIEEQQRTPKNSFNRVNSENQDSGNPAYKNILF